MFKHRMQLAQNKRLPQPTHTSITIRKRMDKLKFIMEHTRAHQQMVRTMLQPIKKISHQIRHTLFWRSHVHTSLIRKHAHTALTILPKIPHYLICCGVSPVCFLKYRQKKLTSVK